MLNVKHRKLALVVDDSAMQCKLLSVILIEEGYQVVTANDGAEGVAKYIEHQPDLVLMDINMPIMNGYQATRKIKEISKGSLAPLIFITSLDTDQAYIESIDAGGDGILVRPFSPEVFKAKIKSIQRISDLYSQVKSLQQAQQQDAELAEKLMSGVIESRNFSVDRIKIIKQAATLFSGDIQLSALCPNGDVNVLLGDFTGHGLRSSIGAIPLAETFRAMTKKGFSIYEIISQVNLQLYNLLPQDLFLAAAFVSISAHDKSAYIFNAGLPDVYLINNQGRINDVISSCHPPLGVMAKLLPDVGVSVKSVVDDDNIVMISDGIIEARNSFGEMFEQHRFESAIIEGAKQGDIANYLMAQVSEFCQQVPQEDDLSIIELPCGGWESENVSVAFNNISHLDAVSFIDQPNWFCSLTLTGEKLANVNPIPIIMNQIQDIEGRGEHWQVVYTIFTELFTNALDHGVLGLSSDLKDSPEGFAQYFAERQTRLNQLVDGDIDIYVELYQLKNVGKIVIKIKDSGKGFNISKFINKASEQSVNKKLSGRGIDLVKQLSNSVNYYENGTLVEAAFLWEKP
jgi:DNA-binding response OmpR family regulator/anti-sigma regulatory factor (Ser/Thr protein kinase)